MRKDSICAVALMLVAAISTSSASASPATFQFVLPSWTDTADPRFDPALFGSHGVLTVAVDNGSASIASQTYLNSEVTSASLIGAGGIFSEIWSGPGVGDGASLSYISTDAAGVPTLDLLAQPPFVAR